MLEKKFILLDKSRKFYIMNNSSVLNILRKFTAKEIKEFGEFASSPFFNKNKNVVKLYIYVKKYYPEFYDKKLEKELVYNKVFSKGKYNDGFMRTVIHQLVNLAEDYLAYVNFTKDKISKNINLLDELNERKLEKVFLKHYSDVEKEVDKTVVKDSEHFFRKIKLNNLMHVYSNWSRFKTKNLKDFEDHRLFEEIRNLTYYYLSSVLKNYRFLLVKQEFEQIEFDFEVVDTIIDFLKNTENEYINMPSVKINMFEILLIKEKSDKYYYLLKDMLLNESRTVSHNNRYSLHNVLHSYCTWKNYEGDEKFINERFELYTIALEQKLYCGNEDLYFDEIMFGSIVLVAIRLRKFDWVESFIDSYKTLLSPENSNITVNFSLAKLHFAKGNYEKSLSSLNEIKSIKHLQYKLVIKDLTMMIYYELSMINQAFYTLDSYRHLLTKNKNVLSDARFERVRNFIKFFTRLAKLKMKNTPKEIQKFQIELKKNANTIEREWMLKKIGELS